ncbi:aminotransferase [Arachidicoccus ginsenosidimutans]|uniref:pyridoxal phosphate-dependent aminotransferase n=1 Tax=Arachidicoccus sp. BS20 TaxID=1850526 RepID=UPI0007F150CE|nr:aminotransferase class I/II-fold pyridoxal phosphate-dependent enzyme [Arachidicoccus sp. BS20]ANI87942.1 aminotransferase [Arachidicoccus sp. BS20]
MATAKRLENIKEYYFSKKLREVDELNKQGKDIINLGIGSPDLPPHPDVIKTLQEESAKPNVHGYQSYKGSPVFRNAIADWYKKWYNVSLDANKEILPLMGSKEGIMHICMTYLQEGDKVLVPNPGYPTYASNVSLTGAEMLPYSLKEENNYEPDFDELEQQDLSKVKLLFANYPQMPTGQEATIELFEKLVAFARKHHILIIHDNPYSFILNENPKSILSVEGALDVAIELNSLSKSHNMAGWRLGMLLAKEERINEILRFKSNMDSGMFLPLQLAAAKALTLGKDWHDSVNKVYKARRAKVYELLDLLECTYRKEQVGLFMWAKIPAKYKDGYELADDILYKANVFITPGGIFGSEGNNYIRISLCGNMERFEEAIRRVNRDFAGLKRFA